MMEKISGDVRIIGSVTGTIGDVSTVSGDVVIPILRDADVYEGDYDITPRLEELILETNRKLMKDNVTVRKIPVIYTSNPQGGQTVIIG